MMQHTMLLRLLLAALCAMVGSAQLKSIACTRGVNLRGGRLICHDRAMTVIWAQLQWRLYNAKPVPPPPPSCEVTVSTIEVRVPTNPSGVRAGTIDASTPGVQLYNTTIIAGGHHYLPTELNATDAEIAEREPHYTEYHASWSADVAMTISGWVDPLANYQLCDVTFAADTPAAVEDLMCTC